MTTTLPPLLAHDVKPHLRFPLWRTLHRVPKVSTLNLRRSIRSNGRDPGPLSDYADLFETLRYPVNFDGRPLALIRVPVKILQEEVDEVPGADYAARFTNWMGIHGVNHLPIDAPAFLADQYVHQPKGEHLFASTQAPVMLRDESINPFFFTVTHDDHGKRLGVHHPADPPRMPHPGMMPKHTSVVFCRP